MPDPVHFSTQEGPTFTAPELPDTAAVWIVRHGSTEWSDSGQHTGVTDLPLTEAGERQAAALRPMFAELSPALVLCSPLQRARRTAELAGLTDVQVEPKLIEWNYGEYEGRTTKDIRTDVPGWTLFTHGVPGGETFEQVAARADHVLQRTVATVAEGPVVLIGHGHFSRVLGARWIGLPVRAGANLTLGTAAPSVLGAQHGEPVITRWNLPNPAAEN